MSIFFLASTLAGVVLALAFAGWLRSRSPRRQARALAVGLSILPLCYVVFALVAGEFGALRHEATGVLAYGALALRGDRRPRLLAVGWLAHIAWDLATPEAHAAYVPAFYAPLCLGFDAVIAAFAWRLHRRLNAGGAAAAPGTR